MSLIRHARIRELFEVLHTRGPVERHEILDRDCAADPELRAEVESLLAEHDRLSGFLEAPALGSGFVVPEAEASSRIPRFLPDRIGGYTILRVLGEGGMGVVYLAEQDNPKRLVALKVIRPGVSSASVIHRFEHEAEVLARLEHPGIARIYQAGWADAGFGPQPFFAMEMVAGVALDRYAVEHALDQRARLALLANVCDAVQHAHLKGVVHRDLKPGNVLVDSSGQPKILDFGVARVMGDRRIDDGFATLPGEFVGTLPYMSPEQFSGDPHDIDVRSDVYALGVIGFELLAGRLPIEVVNTPAIEAARLVREREPPRLGTIDKRLSGDVEAIMSKALEKERDRRYGSASDLAEDIRRHLRLEPIVARPSSRLLRLRRWARRNPALAALAVVLLISVVVLSVLLRIASEAVREKQAALSDYDRLGDLPRLQSLIVSVDRLWPAEPSEAPAMRTWVQQGLELEKRLAGHEKALERMRTSATSRSSGDHPAWTFESGAEQFKHDTTAKLVADLTEFLDPAPNKGVLSRVRDRLGFAETVEHETLRKPAARWAEAIQSIANEHESPKYHGLKITSQLGLIPIAKDPASGLWEFAHLQTTAAGSDPIPLRDEKGRLVVTESTGLVFVLIPGGTFRMGAVKPVEDQAPTEPNVDAGALANESPVTEIRLDPFFLSKYEMTQGQWQRLVGTNPSQHGPGTSLGGKVVDLRNPVETVTWEECDSWLGRLRLILPTEAQWEYAARGGTTTPRWTGVGTEALAKAANLADAFFHGHGGTPTLPYEPWDDGYTAHAPAGSFAPNPFGLHDVYGNVWEWCRDWFGSLAMPVDPGDGLRHPSAPRARVVRGSGFAMLAAGARSAFRDVGRLGSRRSDLGLRPARTLRLD